MAYGISPGQAAGYLHPAFWGKPHQEPAGGTIGAAGRG